MFAIISAAQREECFEKVNIMGVGVWRVSVRTLGWFSRRRLRRTARDLRRRGVRECVFAPDFPAQDIFAAEGLRTVDVSALRRALLVPLCDAALRAEGKDFCAAVAVCAERLRGEWEPYLAALCRRARYVTLVMRDAQPFAARMRRACGASVRCAEASNGAALTVLAEAAMTPAGGHVLPLYGGADGTHILYELPPQIAAEDSSEAYVETLLTAFWRAGAIKTENIRVKSVFWDA